MYDLTTSTAVGGVVGLHSYPPSIGHAFFTDAFFTSVTRSNYTKKKQSKKIDIDMRSRTRLWSVRTPCWMLGPVVGTPAEGICVTPRLWQELVDTVGKSLSLAHVIDRSHLQLSQNGSFACRTVDSDQASVAGLLCRLVCGQQCAERPDFSIPERVCL